MNKIALIVGLGNPGQHYTATRHNAGIWLLNTLAKQKQLSWQYQAKFSGSNSNLILDQHLCRLLCPGTYMNQSGLAVKAVTHFYKIPPEAILIAHDELDLPPGIARFKQGGGHGGHNGLRDIIQQLGSSEFHRLRIGIGHPGHKDQVLDYVLAPPKQAEKLLIIQAIEQAISVLPNYIQGAMQQATQALHTIRG